jgi:hypothetical protein
MMAPEVTPPTPGEGPASFARATRGAAPAAEAASTKVGALGRIMGSIPGMGTLGGAISKVSPVAAAAGIGYGGASAINDVLHPHNGSDIGNEALAARKDFRNAIDQGNYGEAAGQFLGHSAKQLVNVGKALGGPLVSVPLEVARGALHGLGMTGGDGIAQGAQGNLQPHINAADPGAMDRIKEIQARSPEVTSAIEAYHRQNGSVNHDTTHPGIHTAEDWARANSHLTHAQLLDLLKMAPKPVSSKDRIIGNLHNEVQSRYDAKMRAALGLKDQKAQQQAAAEARDEYLKSALPLVQGAATPFDPDLVGRLQE